jgi:tryptophan synthase beta chain
VSRAILFGLSGHGHFDLVAYDKYMAGTLSDEVPFDAALARAAARIPQVSGV